MQSLLEESPDIPHANFESDPYGTNPGVSQFQKNFEMRWQNTLDKISIYLKGRWFAFFLLISAYTIRVYNLQGFYIVTYGLGIFLLNLLIGFLSPLDESTLSDDCLPSNDEFKPFFRRLPEFKFWYACFKAVIIALILTYFPILDIPVFWPILVVYFIVLFAFTMKRQIAHMIKYKYIPFSFGKKTYPQNK